MGRVGVSVFQALRLDSTGLYPVVSMALAALSFGAADVLGGSGFLAVYLTGLALGSATIPARRTVEEFHDGLAWVSQIAVFFTLGLLVFPSEFDDIFGEAVLIVVVLMFVARPLATLVATRVGAVPLRQSVLLGWAGLRGAVPIVLATFPVTEDVPGAEAFFSIVFFVVLTSALVQGVTFESLAEALGLTKDEPALTRPLHEVGTIRHLGAEVYEYPVREKDAIVGKLVNELELPRQALISVIVREDQALLPRGSTEIEAGDRLHILVRQPERERVEGLFDRWREGPIGEIEEPIPTIQGRAPIFSVRPWRDDYGDPGDPEAVEGVKVVRAVRVRRGEPARWFSSRTGASPSPDRMPSRRAARASSSATRATASAAPTKPSRARGGRRSRAFSRSGCSAELVTALLAILVALVWFGTAGPAAATPPSAPVIFEPAEDGQELSPADVHMEAIGFDDTDGDSHTCSDWEIRTGSPDEVVWEAPCAGGIEKVHIHLGDGAFVNSHAGRTQLEFDAAYTLRVRFHDSGGEASSWTARPFVTEPEGPPGVPGAIPWASTRPELTVEKVAGGFQLPVNIAMSRTPVPSRAIRSSTSASSTARSRSSLATAPWATTRPGCSTSIQPAISRVPASRG